MYNELEQGQKALTRHKLYDMLDSLPAVRVFMEHHVFAVWDFMTLLKSLQRRLTCVQVPWRPASADTEAVRFINEIVLGEESDLDAQGKPASHYEMYLAAMEEVGADTRAVREFVEMRDFHRLPEGVRSFVAYNLRLAGEGTDEEVAAAFLFGREKLIPAMFDRIVTALGPGAARDCPTLLFYLQRHIEVDSDEHGPLAQRLLDGLVGDNESLRQRALQAGLDALKLRRQLWDFTAEAVAAAAPDVAGGRLAV